MRVLLDANLPRALGRPLPGHEVVSAHAHEWSDLDDGAPPNPTNVFTLGGIERGPGPTPERFRQLL